MEKHLKLLGWKVKDKVTGFIGVVEHVGIDLYGCVQAIVRPNVATSKDGTQKCDDSRWFDVARLDKIGKAPVMTPIPVKGDLIPAGAAMDKPTK